MGLNLKSFSVEIGFFDDVQHPVSDTSKKYTELYGLKDSQVQSLADVARWVNSGTYNKTAKVYVAPRPFFSNAEIIWNDNRDKILKEAFKTNDPAAYVGNAIKQIIQQEMIDGGMRENTALTSSLKRHSDGTIDSSFMYDHVEVR